MTNTSKLIIPEEGEMWEDQEVYGKTRFETSEYKN
jgi:hypothetical protein